MVFRQITTGLRGVQTSLLNISLAQQHELNESDPWATTGLRGSHPPAPLLAHSATVDTADLAHLYSANFLGNTDYI